SSGAFSALGLAAAAGLMMQTYEVEDEMPDLVTLLARVVLITILVIGLPVWAFEFGIRPLWRFHKSRHYQWPIVSKAQPRLEKFQDAAAAPATEEWLVRVVESDSKNLRDLIFEREQPWIGIAGLTKVTQPYILVVYYYFNLSVFTVTVATKTAGPVYYRKEK